MRFSLLLLLLPRLLGAAALPLYAPQTATPTAQAERWDLRLTSEGPAGQGALKLTVVVGRRGQEPRDGLLLTLSAQGRDPKDVSRKQARVSLEAKQRSAVTRFKLESPSCGNVRVVAALFDGDRPLARVERRVRFPCGGEPGASVKD